MLSHPFLPTPSYPNAPSLKPDPSQITQNKSNKETGAAGTLTVWMNKQYLALIKILLEKLRTGDSILQVLHLLASSSLF